MPLCINSRDGILFFVPDITIIHEENQARSHPNLYGKRDSTQTTPREKLIYHTPSQPKAVIRESLDRPSLASTWNTSILTLPFN